MRRILGRSLLAAAGLASTSCGGSDQTSPPGQVMTVSISPAELTLRVGESQPLTASPLDEGGNPLTGRTVTWATTAPEVAAISGTGVVSGIGPGAATITATSEGKSGSAAIAVLVPVASVTISPAELTLLLGESEQLTATARDEDGTPLEGRVIGWTTSQPGAVTVSATGVVTAVGTGSAIITATAEGKSASASVAVASAPVASVVITPSRLTLLVGASQQLTATAFDADGHPLEGRVVSWTSPLSSWASVSATGLVTGLSPGDIPIIAGSEGKADTATVSVIASVRFTSVATGGAHTCALTEKGAAFCWGRGESGQLGIPVPTTACTTDAGPFPCSKLPVAVSGGYVFTRLAGGGAHTCGLRSDGAAYCWGNNGMGQLGDNTTENRDEPVAVATELRFTSLDAGAQHTCGLTGDGAAYCWGRNDLGQLGDGSTTPSHLPVPVTGNHTFQQIVAGGFAAAEGNANGHTCALSTGGEAWCWGGNDRGQLGIGTLGPGANPEPVQVSGGRTYTRLTVSLARHTCGITGSGAAYCWGENTYGALGDGSMTDKSLPVPVSGGLSFVHLTAGGFIGHTCGLDAGGGAYCWGENSVGQVGDKSETDRLVPAAVSGDHVFTTLDAGYRHTCGLTTDQTLYCWGSNGAGQLGDNSNIARSVPTEVLGQP